MQEGEWRGSRFGSGIAWRRVSVSLRLVLLAGLAREHVNVRVGACARGGGQREEGCVVEGKEAYQCRAGRSQYTGSPWHSNGADATQRLEASRRTISRVPCMTR